MKNIKLLSYIFIPLLIFSFGYDVYAQNTNPNGLISCNGDDCHFQDVLDTFENVINFALAIGIAMVALTIAYAGFQYLTAGGDEGKVKAATQMFTKTAVGFIIALSAYLIVKLLVTTLGLDQSIIKLLD